MIGGGGGTSGLPGLSGDLADIIINSVRELAVEVRRLALAETGFRNGILSSSNGGTGQNNSPYTLTLTANSTLNGTPAAASHTHPTGDIVSGTMATARLGSGSAVANTLLHGDSTWDLVDLNLQTSSTLGISRGGTGATSAGAALTALGAAAASHTHSAYVQYGSSTAGRLVEWHSSGTIQDSNLDKFGAGYLILNAGSDATLNVSSDGTLNMGGGTLTLGGATLSLPVSIANGGTGSTSASAARTALGAAATSHTHAASDIASGTIATARLGSGSAVANTILHGDSTWDLVDLNLQTSATLGISRGGTGATSAGAALTALGAAAASHTHAAADITSGTIATARLGSGTANSSSYLRGDQTWATISAITGSGANGQVAYWTGTSTLDGSANLTINSASGNMTITGDFVANSVDTDGTDWRFGPFTSTGDAVSNGYMTIVAGGTTYRLMTRA